MKRLMPPDNRNSRAIARIRDLVLSWYHRHGRNLPWRGESDPYRIWVAEVMLQQTQVVTVIPYYTRFLAQFPTLESLAAASPAEVLKAWEGLGYYARARNLHKAAVEIVKNRDGRFPKTFAGLRTLPGFGSYTAGAVASIAFGQAVPAVDGNARRVLARLFALQGNVRRAPVARRVQELAAALVDPHRPGNWTQALMELGALVCLPRSPRCPVCPVQEVCQARQQGVEHDLPMKPAKKSLPHYHVTAAVIGRDGKVLIAQRPMDGMLGGLWEFPGGKQQPGETLPQCLAREIREELGLEIEVGQPVITVKHSYTHFKITLHAFHCRVLAGQPRALQVAGWRWVTLAELDSFPFPRTDQKIIAALKNEKSPA